MSPPSAISRWCAVDNEPPARISAMVSLLPWDWRAEKPAMIDEIVIILPELTAWAAQPAEAKRRARSPGPRASLFGGDGSQWDGERVLDRYELLGEAGWSRKPDDGCGRRSPDAARSSGVAMRFDHRRILATAIARLRASCHCRWSSRSERVHTH